MATSLRRGLSFAGAQRCSVLPSARRFLSPSDAWLKSSRANWESFRAFQWNTSVEGLLFTHPLILQHKKALARWENPLIGWTSTGDSYASVGDAGLSFDGEKAGKAFTERRAWKLPILEIIKENRFRQIW